MSRARTQPAPSEPGGIWCTFALRGLLAVHFGLLVIIWTGFALYTLPLLITLLGAYILTVIAAVRPS